MTVVMKYHGLTRSNERDYKHVTFSDEHSHMLLWQKDPLFSVFSVEFFRSKLKSKNSVLESAQEPRLARITARATTNNETDKNEIVTNALKGQICSVFETNGFNDEARKGCPS